MNLHQGQNYKAGDDFFFTGGGFSDWSGESAGKFDEKPSYWDESSDDADEEQ